MNFNYSYYILSFALNSFRFFESLIQTYIDYFSLVIEIINCLFLVLIVPIKNFVRVYISLDDSLKYSKNAFDDRCHNTKVILRRICIIRVHTHFLCYIIY